MTFVESIEPVIKAVLKSRCMPAARLIDELGIDSEDVYEALVSMESRGIVKLDGGRPHRGPQCFKWRLAPAHLEV